MSTNKKQNLMKIGILLLICVAIVVLFGFAYAKYTTTIEGNASAKVASMICEMEVEPSEANKEIINPYCIVKVKNYNAEEVVSETSVSFKIEVTPKEEFEMPEYYWEDSNGTIIARSTELTGLLKLDEKELKEYKIVFLNSGEEDITRLVDFNLVAIQGNEGE